LPKGSPASSSRVVINQSPRPRLLVCGFRDKPEFVKELLKIAPTSRAIEALKEVWPAEWDVLITDETLVSAAEHLCVIHVPAALGHALEDRLMWDRCIAWFGGHVCQELKRISGLPERIAILAHEQLEPLAKQRRDHGHVAYGQTAMRFSASTEAVPDIEPFLMTAADRVLAGRYRRGPESEAWIIPGDVPDLLAWVRAALAEWHALAPDRFPGVPDWSESDEWMTGNEKAVRTRLAVLEREHEAAVLGFERNRAALRAELRKAREDADGYERSLLTAQSDALKVTVMRALRDIGFAVKDADADAKPDEHLEDLHVQDYDLPEWIALAEVKGYTKGARTEGLTQFLRFHARYRQRTGAEPTASWYVVNQFLARDPSVRPQALKGQDEDVAAFAAVGGLVIDTVTLFRMLCAVKEDVITTQAARELLRGSRGRLVF